MVDPPAGMNEMAWRCAGLAMMMAVFWSVEILPTAITALLPLIMSPMLGLASIDKAAIPYAHPVIFLFMGGFVLGLAMERWNLHSRIALKIMMIMGTGEKRLVLGFYDGHWPDQYVGFQYGNHDHVVAYRFIRDHDDSSPGEDEPGFFLLPCYSPLPMGLRSVALVPLSARLPMHCWWLFFRNSTVYRLVLPAG